MGEYRIASAVVLQHVVGDAKGHRPLHEGALCVRRRLGVEFNVLVILCVCPRRQDTELTRLHMDTHQNTMYKHKVYPRKNEVRKKLPGICGHLVNVSLKQTLILNVYVKKREDARKNPSMRTTSHSQILLIQFNALRSNEKFSSIPPFQIF